MVKRSSGAGTRLIDLFATNRDPVMAQRLAEAVVVNTSGMRRGNAPGSAKRFYAIFWKKKNVSKAICSGVRPPLPNTRKRLRTLWAARRRRSCHRKSDRCRKFRWARRFVEDKLQELTSKLTAAKADRIRIENEISKIEGIGDNVDALLAIPSIAAAPTVNDRAGKFHNLRPPVGTLAGRYKDKHPKMVAARAAMKNQRCSPPRGSRSTTFYRTCASKRKRPSELADGGAGTGESGAGAQQELRSGTNNWRGRPKRTAPFTKACLRQIKETEFDQGREDDGG